MSASPAVSDGADDRPAPDRRIPAFVDWLMGAVMALAGLLSLVCGSALAFVVGSDLLADQVEAGTITVTLGASELTDAETLEVVGAVVSGAAIGLLLTGVGMIVFACWYVVRRRRAHRRARTGGSVGSYWAYAVAGAMTTGLLSFVPFSPVLGGALAGYLERAESDRTVSVGALAGLLPLLPLLLLVGFVLGGLVVGLLAVDHAVPAAVVAGAMLLTVLLIGTVGAGLGALGGYAGGRYADKQATTE